MRISTAPLAELATRALGRRVLVHLGHSLPFGVPGLAYFDRAGAPVIELNPTIFEAKDAHELGRVFWHELGHVKLGHVSEARARSGPVTAAEMDYSTKYATETQAGQTLEAQADAFSLAMRRRYPDADLWALCVVE